jgi:RHS repeat-associated protein
LTAFNYDAAGRRLAVTNAFGVSGIAVTNFYGYDANGNQITFTDGLGHATTNFYDALNRQTNVTFTDGTRQITVYDAGGRRIAQTDQATNTTGFAYDGLGRLTAVTNALGGPTQVVTQYQYDEAGNQTAQIDALKRTTTFEYDSMGRRTKRTLPGNQFETFGYDFGGNLIRYTNFNGVIVTNQYDVMNRLTNRISINGYKIRYTYTATGQRQTMTDASGTQSYAYDARDRLLTNATPAGTLSYQYDANGNVTNITSSTANGTLVTYQYDALNRLTNVVDSRLVGATNTAYGFDAVGNLQRIQYPNSVTNLYKYDSLNRLTNLVWKTNGNVIASFAYTLGASRNRTALLETNHGDNRGYTWNYDALYRLTNETVTGTAPTGNNGYGYDDVGNRTIRTNIASGLGLANQSFTFTANDWLTGDVYDSNGNTRTNASNQPYFYDCENRLTNFNNGQVIIVYDADGNRVKKVANGATNLYLVDTRNPSGYAQVLEEFTVSGGVTNLAKAYTYGLNLISQRAPGSSTNFFTYDGHGSTRMLTDAVGNFVNAFMYDAYGNLIASNSTPQTVYLYACQQWDPDLSQYYNRARTWQPNTGRFWTMDTYTGNNEDPLSLHKYLYCQGNPVDNGDPSGNDVVGDFAMGGMDLSSIDATSIGRIGTTAIREAIEVSKPPITEHVKPGDHVPLSDGNGYILVWRYFSRPAPGVPLQTGNPIGATFIAATHTYVKAGYHWVQYIDSDDPEALKSHELDHSDPYPDNSNGDPGDRNAPADPSLSVYSFVDGSEHYMPTGMYITPKNVTSVTISFELQLYKDPYRTIVARIKWGYTFTRQTHDILQ